MGLEFGEKVLYKVKRDTKMGKLRSRWEYGIFVGVRQRSGEVWIATPDKTLAARSVRRIREEQRWGEACVGWVKRPLWNRYKEDSGADGDLPEAVPQAVAQDLLGPRGGMVVITKEKAPRYFYIRKSDA